jgi:hypothetical protein
MGGVGALYDCASYETCRCRATIPHGANEQVTKTRAIRGQRRQCLCCCERPAPSDTCCGRCCQSYWSVGPSRLRRRNCSKKTRVSRVGLEPPRLGRCLPPRALCVQVTRSRTQSSHGLSPVCPNSFAIVRRTLFKLELSHCEAAHGRLPCTRRRCTARRCRRNEITPHDRANKRSVNMRAIRGQRRQWLCFSRRLEASDMVLRPWLPMNMLSRADAASLLPWFKKRASCSSLPRAPSSRPEIATVSTTHARVTKPRAMVGRTRVSVSE